MVLSSSTEPVGSHNSLTQEQASQHGDQTAIDEQTVRERSQSSSAAGPSSVSNDPATSNQQNATVERQQDAVLSSPTQATDDDIWLRDWSSLRWWQKPIQAVRLTGFYLRGLILYGFLMCIVSMDDDQKSDRRRDEQEQESLLPSDASSTIPSSQLQHVPGSLRASNNFTKGFTDVCSSIVHRVLRLLRRRSPQILYALFVLAAVKIGAPPRQDQQVCIARQTGEGFTGNSDMYGLGIRLGIYIQWICATLAIKFLPSARRYVVSGYLFYQLGMVVAMCLLLSPNTCTFTAEVAIILQFLWGGSAAVLVPSVKKGTSYDSKSKYLGIDILTTITGTLLFVFTSWFYLRLFFRGQYDFTDTPGIGTITFWVGPVKSSDTVFYSRIRILWIMIATFELFEVFQDQPGTLKFSGFLDWYWWTSTTIATGSLALVLQGLVKMAVMFAVANETMLNGFVDPPVGRNPLSVPQLLLFLCKATESIIRTCWWLTRHCIIVLWAIMSIEYMIQSNNIEGVRSLDSTGQIIPLTMGVATALSLLYLWVKNFFNRGTAPDTEETSPLTLEQAIGFPTATGHWI